MAELPQPARATEPLRVECITRPVSWRWPGRGSWALTLGAPTRLSLSAAGCRAATAGGPSGSPATPPQGWCRYRPRNDPDRETGPSPGRHRCPPEPHASTTLSGSSLIVCLVSTISHRIDNLRANPADHHQLDKARRVGVRDQLSGLGLEPVSRFVNLSGSVLGGPSSCANRECPQTGDVISQPDG
jgi:hypothetical protein